MPFLSSPLLLRTYALTLALFAYYLFTSPLQLVASTPIWLLGESMSVRPASYAPEHPGGPSLGASTQLKSILTGQGAGTSAGEKELFALLAVMVVVYAGTIFLFAGDLTLLPASKGDVSGKVSEAKSSARYAEELHTLLTAQSRWLAVAGLHVLGSSLLVAWIYVFHSHSWTARSLPSASLSGPSLVANRVTFTAALIDMLFWGYLWTVLKDEGREVGKALARRREIEDDMDE